MNAARILETLAAAGIACRREGDRLKLQPASGSVPADLIELARAHKPELLAALADPTVQRKRLLLAAAREGIDPEVIHCLTDADIEGCQFWSDVQLRTCVRWHRDDPPALWRKGGDA